MWILHATEPRLHTAYAGTAQPNLLWDLLALALIIGGLRLVGLTVRQMHAARRHQANTRLATDVLAHLGQGPLRGARVLEHTTPAAFCIPGRGDDARIVLTSAAVRLLKRAEISATVEHERAHLLYRHHRMILLAEVLTASVGWCGAMRNYARQVRRLAEMVADDHAAISCGERVVASALLQLSEGGPAGSLAMSGSAPAERIRRLVAGPRSSQPRPQRWVTGLTTALILVPSLVLLAPALSVAGSAH